MERGWVGYRKGDADLDYVLERMRDGAVVIFDGLDEALVKLSIAAGQTFTNGLLRLRGDYRARYPKGASRENIAVLPNALFPQPRRSALAFRRAGSRPDQGGRRPCARTAALHPEQVGRYLARTLPGQDTEQLMEIIQSVHNLRGIIAPPLYAEADPRLHSGDRGGAGGGARDSGCQPLSQGGQRVARARFRQAPHSSRRQARSGGASGGASLADAREPRCRSQN